MPIVTWRPAQFRTVRHSAACSGRLWRPAGALALLAACVAALTFTVTPANAAGCTVSNTADSGAGSLRQAISDSNAGLCGGTISFNIGGGGIQTITPASVLPAITLPVVIDGYTQPGAAANTLAVGSNAVILIELNGDTCGTGCDGLTVSSGGGGSTIQGLAVSGNFNNGITLEGGAGSTVAGNFVGLHADGTPHGVNASGIYVDNTANNMVGGATPAARNVISANRDGIFFAAGAANNTGNVVQGNVVGTNPAGTAAGPGNRDHGIYMGIFGPYLLTGNVIGGSGAGAGNLIAYNASSPAPLFSPAAGLLLNSGTGNTIRGNQISGNAAPGLWIVSSGTIVAGNMIGTDATGTAAFANTGGGVGLVGSGNTVGSSAAGDRNLISGNAGAGILITGATASSNVVAGNYIGTNATGTAALSNSTGVQIQSGASNNIIGGTAAGTGNLISGNTGFGVAITGVGENGNQFLGNDIGTNAAGTLAIPNGSGATFAGIFLGSGASTVANTVIGGAAPGARNVIAGNNGDGVALWDGTTGTQIQGNYIGVGADGVTALGNNGAGVGGGVAIRNFASNNTIGGANPGEGNLIANNAPNGIINYSGANDNILGNQISSNAGPGVWIGGSNNTVGGLTAGAANKIAFNTGAGVAVDASTGNAIRLNSIHDNAAGGISLTNGANNNQAAPTVTVSANRIADATPTTSLGGTFTGAANASYSIDLYSNPACAGAEGQIYVGSANVTTDGSGQGTFLIGANPMFAAGGGATATATDAGSNTSTFSTCTTATALNNSWVLAAPLAPSPSASATPYIFQAGQSRWYWFTATPGEVVTVSVTGPAGTILALDRDLNKIYNQLALPQSAASLAANDLPGGYLPGGYLPGGYLPGGYLPGGYLPGGYLPGGYLPGGYLPGGYLPGGYLPGGYLPGGYLPGGYLPGGYLPGGYLPGGSLPGGYLPGGYLPGGYLPGGYLPAQYSSAVRQGLMAFASDPAATTQTIVRNTWDLSENLYVMVSGQASLSTPVNVQVTRSDTGSCAGANLLADPGPSDTIVQGGAPAGTASSLILWDSHRLLADSAQADVTALGSKLASFAQRPDVNGVLIDLANTTKLPRVAAANATADAHTSCIAAKNSVATEIKRVVDLYRAANAAAGQTTVQYIVLAGSDSVIPFFRYPDVAGLANENEYIPPVSDASASQASLRQGQVLGQDAYGAANNVTRSGFTMPVPQIAVGRLVRTAPEMSAMLDAYVATNGVVAPGTGLTTGYDFVADAATAVRSELYQGFNPANCGADPNNVPAGCQVVDQLITPKGASLASAWTAANLRQSLFGARHDLVFFAGHFSAGSLVPGNYDSTNTVQASEVLTSSANFTNSLILALGCHSGYDIPASDAVSVSPRPDWPEAFNARGATFVAATGYAYGDTDLTEYGERLFVDLAQQLRTGPGAIAIGSALVASKQAYLAQHVALVGLDDKTLIETTLYGLPMLKVNLPGQRIVASDPSIVGSVVPVANNNVGLQIGQAAGGNGSGSTITLQPALTRTDIVLTDATTNNPVTASYFTGSGGVVARPAEPIFPLERRNVSVPGQILRGIGLWGGTYADQTGITPLTSAATTEASRAHPGFYSDVLYPAQVWSANYFNALQGGATGLMVAPAQYQSSAPGVTSGTLRTFSNLQFHLFYLDANWTSRGFTDTTRLAAIAAAPNIESATGVATGGNTAQFTVTVQSDVEAPPQEVWVTWTDPNAPGQWQSADLGLTQSPTDATQWQATGTLSNVPATAVFMVQAANSSGLVSLATNGGAYYKLAAAGAPAPQPQQTTTLNLTGPASGAFGSTQNFQATLTSGGNPVANQSVTLSLNGQIAFGNTNGSGVASFALKLSQLPGSDTAQATFVGVPSTSSVAGYTGSSASAPFSVLKANPSETLSPASPVSVVYGGPTGIVATLTDGAGQALVQKSLVFVATNNATNNSSELLAGQTDVNGQAALGTTSLAPATYTLNVYFSGNIPGVGQFSDNLYNPSVASLPLTINKAVLTFTANQTRVYGAPNPITFTVSYSGFVLGQMLATSGVTGSPACTITATTTSAPGAYPITCTAGMLTSSNYSFTFIGGTLTVTTASSAVALTSAPNPSILAQPVVFTATVTAVAPGSGTPTGTVTLKDGPTVLGTASLNIAGQAVFTTTAVPVGAQAITASYGGNASFNASVSSTVTQTVHYEPAGTNCLGQPGHQILPPIKADGSTVFVQGRRLVLRFRVCDFNGQSIGTPGVATSLVLLKKTPTTNPVNNWSDYDGDDDSWHPDGLFHWNPLRQRWYYQLSTANLRAGYFYFYRITLNDGTFIDFSFGLGRADH